MSITLFAGLIPSRPRPPLVRRVLLALEARRTRLILAALEPRLLDDIAVARAAVPPVAACMPADPLGLLR